MRTGRVVVAGSAIVLASGVGLAAVHGTSTTTPQAKGTVTSCLRDADGYVGVAGQVQNLRDVPARVEITVAVVDTSTGNEVDYTQAKSGVLNPGQTQGYTAAVYNPETGESSVPMYMTIKCSVVVVKAMDPDEIG
jgi:hypothetical protein